MQISADIIGLKTCLLWNATTAILHRIPINILHLLAYTVLIWLYEAYLILCAIVKTICVVAFLLCAVVLLLCAVEVISDEVA